MKAKTLTRDELLAAIDEAIGPAPADPGVTILEFATARGLSQEAARCTLERGVRLGKLVRGSALRPRTNGRVSVQNVYRPVDG